MQSWLWAVQNQDSAKMLQALSTAEAQGLQARMRPDSLKKVFKDLEILPGLAIQSRQNLPDGSVELEVYFVPNLPAQKVRLHQQPNGEWKMDSFLE
jgi:phage tail sheath protein FI